MQLKNQKGFTLLEIMVAVGLMGALSLAGMQLFKNQTAAQRNVEANYEVVAILNQIRSVLNRTENCTRTFSAGFRPDGTSTPGAPTFLQKERMDGSGWDRLYEVGVGQPGNIKIVEYRLSKPATGFAANEAKLSIVFSKGKGAIREESIKALKMVYTLNASGNILTCYAFNSASDTLWVQSTVDPNDIYYPGGDVGIGTVDPLAKFHIVASATTQAAPVTAILLQGSTPATSGPNSAQDIRWMFGTNTESAIRAYKGTSTDTYIQFLTTNIAPLNTPQVKVTIDGVGRMGIGNAIPVSKLHVEDVQVGTADPIALSFMTQDVDQLLYSAVRNTNQNGSASFPFAGFAAEAWSSTDSTYIQALFGVKNNSSGSQGSTIISAPRDFRMYVNRGVPTSSATALGDEVIRVSAASMVGIRNTTPMMALDVSGTVSAPVTSGTTPLGSMRVGATGINQVMDIGASNASGGYVWMQGTSRAGLSATTSLSLNPTGGRVGVGTIAPSATLHVEGDMMLGEDALGATASGSRLYFSGTGNNTDPIYIYRINNGSDSSELRFVMGDNNSSEDKASFSTTSGFLAFQVFADGNTTAGRVASANGFRAAQGAPNGSNTGNTLGFSFAEDGDTGVFNTLGGPTGNLSLWVNNVEHMKMSDNVVTVMQTLESRSFNYWSDRTLKKDIQTIENPMDKIRAFRGVNFTWKNDETKDIGFIAQEIEKIEPRLVVTNKEGIKSVKYGNIIAIVVEAIKNLASDSDDLKEQLRLVKEENALLKKKLAEHDERLNKIERN